jgi:hypothetical protein
LVLNHESWFMAPAVVVVCAVPNDGLPPKAIDRTPRVPSSKSEATSTVPLGSRRYGVPWLRERLAPAVVSLRSTLRT